MINKYSLALIILVALGYCALSGLYFYDDWLSGLIGGVIGSSFTVISGVLIAATAKLLPARHAKTITQVNHKRE